MLVIEGLGTGLVGAYGSSTASTPTLDRMAAQGLVLDQCFVDSQAISRQLRSLWTGSHALQTDSLPWNLWHSYAARWKDSADSSNGSDSSARLLTDSRQVAELAGQLGCPQVTLIEADQQPQQPASDTAHCAVVELLATAASELASGPPGLVWIHSRGLQQAWDAPLDMRAQFADPDDPEPPHEVDAPQIDVDASTDPDFVVGWGQVAAAQTAVIDEAIAAVREAVAQRADAAAWSWLFTSLGGVPLGEHGRLGWGRPQLVGSELQTATIIVPAGALPVGLRRPELFQLPDIAATLARLLHIDVPSNVWGRDALALGAAQSPDRWAHELRLAMVADSQQCWLRSPAWAAVLENLETDVAQAGQAEMHNASPGDKLFVKPEDRWEVSQIADRRRDVLAIHRELAEQFMAAAQRGERSSLPALHDDLLNLLR